MDILLKNLCWYNGLEKVSGDVRISKGSIVETGINLSSKRDEQAGDFQGEFLYPGLINAHDHLEMNLYPRLGNPPYTNYVEWSKDIYHPSKSPIREIERLDIKARLLWGGLKNLISGATTVVHHNPWHRMLEKSGFPVNVLKIDWAHSIAFEKTLAKKVLSANTKSFVIHAGEGTDDLASSEIQALNKLKLLKESTVLVHAVAINEYDIETLAHHRSSVVWCPASNFFMFNQTAPLSKLKQKVRVSLGSDSTLTGSATLLHEMQCAAKTNLASAEEIYGMVSLAPAQIFNLPLPLIDRGLCADLFTTPIKHKDYFQNLLATEPGDISMVMTRGIPRLKNAISDLRWSSLKNPVSIQGTLKLSDIKISALNKQIRKKVSLDVLEKNSLWKLIEI